MDNVILIGMPAAGKSTVGVLLAKSLIYTFTDTDLLIQEKWGASLCELIEKEGEDAFIGMETEVLDSLNARHAVIATGGSAVYGGEGIRHLRDIGTVVYLKLDLAEISRRIGNIRTRGVVMHHSADMREMYLERCALYEAYADITVDCSGKTAEECVGAVLDALRGK